METNRRTFVKDTAVLGVGLSLLNSPFDVLAQDMKSVIRLGFIGVGLRGQDHLAECIKRTDCDVMAICDPDIESAIPRSREIIQKQYGSEKRIAEYTNGEEDFLNLLARDDIDAVIVATPWRWHSVQGVAAMKAGKAVGMEVAGATNMKECWDLVEASEQTRVPLFAMENVCYRRDVMAVLNMVRQGVFGELLHLQEGIPARPSEGQVQRRQAVLRWRRRVRGDRIVGSPMAYQTLRPPQRRAVSDARSRSGSDHDRYQPR